MSWKPRGGVEVELYSYFNLGARWGGLSTPRSCRFTQGKDLVLIVLEAGWVLGPVWRSAENLAPTGIRSPARPARSESLYLLSYLALCKKTVSKEILDKMCIQTSMQGPL